MRVEIPIEVFDSTEPVIYGMCCHCGGSIRCALFDGRLIWEHHLRQGRRAFPATLCAVDGSRPTHAAPALDYIGVSLPV